MPRPRAREQARPVFDTTQPQPLVPVPHAVSRPRPVVPPARPDEGPRRGRRAAWGLLVVLSVAVAGYALYLAGTGFAALPDGPADNGLPLALQVHVVTAAAALLLWPLQTVRALRRRHPAVHRWTGRAYVLACLAGGVTGVLAAVATTAGPVAGAGFLLLGLAWIGCTVEAVLRVRAGDVAGHRRWMVRSVALTLAAVTLRLHLGTSGALGAPFDDVYPAVAWLCWVPNLVVAQWWIARHPDPA
jgi:uncharacterized membrane protein